MRHLVWQGPGKLAWEDVPDPSPGPTDAVIRPLAVGRCDLDPVMAAVGIYPGPFPVGHEVVGEVVERGEAVLQHRAGDRVVVPFQVSCGGCGPCRSSRFAACTTHDARIGAAFGFGEAGGGHGGAVADLMLVPGADHMLHAAPEALATEALCLLPDNVLDGYRAVAPPLAETPGADVLVVGGAAPSVGLYAVMFAVLLGAETVRYVDTDERRCAIAERLGATALHHDGPWPKGFERALVTVENTGDPDGVICTIRSTEDYGTCTPVSVHFAPTTPVPLLAMYTRGITLRVARADSRRYLAEVLRLASAGLFDPLAIEPRVVGFDEASDAWLDEPQTKLVVTATG